MEFFCYHRDRPGSAALREKLTEEHWSYMDRFDARLIARGPTLDGDTATGSVHIADLPDPAAARAFAFDEPNYQARRIPGRAVAPLAQRPGSHHVGLPRWPRRRQPLSGSRPRHGPGRRPPSTARPAGRPDRLRVAAVRRRRHLAGHGSLDPGGGSGHGPHRPDLGPLCRHRSPPLGVRRTTMINGGGACRHTGSSSRMAAACSAARLSYSRASTWKSCSARMA
ncbi:YciI family protein [Nonomuraea ferruginea]